MRHSTKVDWWLAALVIGIAVLCLVGGVWLIIQGGDRLLGLGGAVAGLGILAVSWPTHYTLRDGLLLVRSGVFLWRVPLQAIEGVHHSRNPLSAPAWSLKRLRVDYARASGRSAFVLISPKDADLFMRDLAGLDAGLVLDFDHLVRRSPAHGPGGV